MAKTNDKAKVVDNTNVEVVEEGKKKPFEASPIKEINKAKKDTIEVKKSDKVVDKSRELYYFYSVGCGWCKRTEPLIDELNEEGYNILKLDLADGDNKKLEAEVKKSYNRLSTNAYKK